MGLEIFLKDREDVAITITRDDRGDGYSLFRRNDRPRVDFSRIEGLEGVVFAHKGGFVAKVTADADVKSLIASKADSQCP